MDKQKKQTIIVGALFAVFVAVGAFSFLGGGKPEAPAAKKEETKVADDLRNATDQTELDPEISAMVGKEFASRDPFKPLSEAAKLTANTVTPPAPTKLATTAPPKTQLAPVTESGTTPMAPLPGAVSSAPTPDGQVATTTQQAEQSKPVRDPSIPPYRVIGTITEGSEPIAILEAESGKQIMLKIGESTGTARLLSISRRHVLIRYGGKQHSLSMAD